MITRKPVLYISWIEKGEDRKIGPFYTVTPDGYHAYKVQYASGEFRRITIPSDYVLFSAMI